MNQSEEIKRLSDAVAGLTSTILQVITDRLQKIASVQEQKLAAHTIDPILTKKQVAEPFHASIRTINTWMDKGYLPYWRIGKCIRFRLSDVQKRLDERHRIDRRAWR